MLAEERILDVLDRGMDGLPVLEREQGMGQRQDLGLLDSHVLAQGVDIGAGDLLDGFARGNRIVDDVFQMAHQVTAALVKQHVLRREFVDGPGDCLIALADLGEDQVFLRVVQDIGVVRHVEHDVEHQLVVGPLAAVEQRELIVEQREQPRKVDVFRVPQGQGIGHGCLRLREHDAPQSRRASLRQMLRQDGACVKRTAPQTLDPGQNQGGLRVS